MARLSPALARTFRLGACALPIADYDILRTGNASTTTAPWFLVVLVLWRKSLRAFATRWCRRAMRRIALRRLRLPRRRHALREAALLHLQNVHFETARHDHVA